MDFLIKKQITTMEKFIPKSAVVAELENIESSALCEYKSNKSRYAEGCLDVAHRVKHFLDTFKVEEEDFEEETTSIWILDFYHCQVRRVELSKEKEEEFDELDNTKEFFAKYADAIGYNEDNCTYIITSNKLKTIKL